MKSQNHLLNFAHDKVLLASSKSDLQRKPGQKKIVVFAKIDTIFKFLQGAEMCVSFVSASYVPSPLFVALHYYCFMRHSRNSYN